MLRKVVYSVLALGIVSVTLLADEYRGRVKSVDADKHTITITTRDSGEKEFHVTPDTKIEGAKGEIKGGLKNKMFSGAKLPAVSVRTEKKDGKEVAVEIKVMAGKKGGKKGGTDK